MSTKFARYNPETYWNRRERAPAAVMTRSQNGKWVNYNSVAKEIDRMQAEINQLTQALAHAKLQNK
jgi:hypothetical protein